MTYETGASVYRDSGGNCSEIETCEKLGAVIGNNADACRRLKG